MPIRIPTRFEHVLNQEINPTPLIVSVEQDLQAIDRLRRQADVQQGGLLSFVVGKSGVGKTTAVYSAASLLPDRFAPVVSVPHSVPLRAIPDWLSEHLPRADSSGRAILLLLDNREMTDDTVGLGQLMSALNGLLRSRSDVLALWPTTDNAWRDQLRGVAERIGGESLVPAGADLTIAGPDRERWGDVLERLLSQFDQRLEDLALDPDTVASFQRASPSVGSFLVRVRDAIAGRVDEVQLSKGLPHLVFVVTSGSEVVGEANRLRRAGTLLLKAEELLAYSGRSGAADYWKARSATPEHHLAYIISLFQARLTTMTASSVGYACLEFGDPTLKQLAKDGGMTKNAGNADRTFTHTDFYKYLTGQTTFELTSGSKGHAADSTMSAYASIQRVSATKHKSINQALCSLADRNVPGFAAATGAFEVDLGQAKVFADAVIDLNDQEQHLEFHHLSAEHCTASKISAYVMGKLKSYAVHYNLTPL